jgi:hypothetical protein
LYMWLLIICNYLWTFLQLLLILVIFAIILVFILPYEQHLVWFSSKKNNLCPISCKCDQFKIQRCILCILKNIIEYIIILKCIFGIYMNDHITSLSKLLSLIILLHNDDDDISMTSGNPWPLVTVKSPSLFI